MLIFLGLPYFHLAQCLWSSAMLYHMAEFHFQAEYHVHVYITFPRSVYLSDFWAAPNFGQLWRALLWGLMSKYPRKVSASCVLPNILQVLLVACSELELLGRVVKPGLIFGRISMLLCTGVKLFEICAHNVQGFSSLHTIANTCCLPLFRLKRESSYVAPTSQVAKIVDTCHLRHRAYCFLGSCFVFSIVATLLDVKWNLLWIPFP